MKVFGSLVFKDSCIQKEAVRLELECVDVLVCVDVETGKELRLPL